MANVYSIQTYWEKKEPIESGTQSSLYYAINNSDEKWYAMKIYNEATPLFIKEIENLSKLDHPNIIKIIDYDKYFRINRTPWFILELAEKGDLYNLIIKNPENQYGLACFPELVARTYFIQLMEGVEYMHDRGVVHGDLKPENLLLDENYTLKICDFAWR